MTGIESWDPEQGAGDQAMEISATALAQFIEISAQEKLDNLNQALSTEQIASQRPLMRQHKDAWAIAATPLSEQQIIHLIRFFTVAEQQLAGWEAGSLSPVIWLCRELKARGAFPDKDLIAWIKANTDNKFLPYGNVLDL